MFVAYSCSQDAEGWTRSYTSLKFSSGSQEYQLSYFLGSWAPGEGYYLWIRRYGLRLILDLISIERRLLRDSIFLPTSIWQLLPHEHRFSWIGDTTRVIRRD